MSEGIERLESELLGELLATQNVLVIFMDHLHKSGVVSREFIEGVFHEADLLAEATALRIGKQGDPIHTAKHMEVLKELRAVCLPN